MHLGILGTTGLLVWGLSALAAPWLARRAQRHARARFGPRAARERRVCLLAAMVPLASLAAALLLIGTPSVAAAGAPAGPDQAWRTTGLVLVVVDALAALAACGLVVLGMLRGTIDWRVLRADVVVALAGLVSLWAVAENLSAG